MEQFATRCPYCQTSFRVTPAQLEQRGGKVRCGVCHESFDGIDQLFDYSDDAPLASAHSTEATTKSASVHRSWEPAEPVATVDFGTAGVATGSSMQAELDALSQAITDLQTAPWSAPMSTGRSEFSPAETPRDDLADSDEEGTHEGAHAPAHADLGQDPGFVQEAHRRVRSRRAWKVLLWIGIPLLTLALAAQLVYTFRNDIAARSPFAARQLRSLCTKLGCTIRLPMQLDSLSLNGSRLDVAPLPMPLSGTDGQPTSSTGPQLAQRLTLIALLRNQGDTVQTWPSIELRLKGSDGKIFVRKAFMPAQYVRAEDLPVGMQARSETEIRIPFELAADAPAGFELTLFYH